MKYFIELESPETIRKNRETPKQIAMFRDTLLTDAKKIKPGDKLICYCTKIKRITGIAEVLSESFIEKNSNNDNTSENFPLKFKIKQEVNLPLDKSIPILDDLLWNNLSFTKSLEKNGTVWAQTCKVSRSLREWPTEDGKFIEKVLKEQSKNQKSFPFCEEDLKVLKSTKIILPEEKTVEVFVPNETEENQKNKTKEQRESIKIQAALAQIGETLGLKIWIPMSDRSRVIEVWKPKTNSLLNELPLVFDEITLKTIKNIDLLWIKGRTIIRAFEVEDTTSIYSGILRMADLLSLQPMIDIKIHIVAPEVRKTSVFQQIKRPVFSVMEKGPLSEICSYISYDSIYELKKINNLEHMTDSIIDEYTIFSEDSE